jgi:hypothetical protein
MIDFDVNIITKKVNEKKPLRGPSIKRFVLFFPSQRVIKKGLLPSQRQALPLLPSFCYFQ